MILHSHSKQQSAKKAEHNTSVRLSDIQNDTIPESVHSSPAKPVRPSFQCDCINQTSVMDNWSLKYCPRTEEWLHLAFKNSAKPFDYETDCETYNALASMINDDFKDTTEYQKIKQDVNRTVSDNDYFQEGGKGYEDVLNVLASFQLYDRSCGYVQGMNFIAAALVYHCNPEIAFWLLTTLFEEFELRKNYSDGFPGYYQRSEYMESLL